MTGPEARLLPPLCCDLQRVDITAGFIGKAYIARLRREGIFRPWPFHWPW